MGFANDPVDDYGWARRLLETRSPDGFRAYGAETGLWKLDQAWNHFLFTRDARELAFTSKRLQALAEKTYDWQLRFGLNVPGAIHDDPRKQITPRERSAWLNGFIEAYKEALDENVSEIIPPEIEDKLPLFCDLVASVQNDAEAGHESSEFGVRLGAPWKPKEVQKIHPKREAIIKKAKAEGLKEAKLHWLWQENSAQRIRRPQFISAPYDWELSPLELELYEELFEKAYMQYVREKIAKVVPAKTWKNAFLICSLFDEMEQQRHEGRSSSKDYGWSYLRYLRENEHRRTEERLKIENEAKARRWSRSRPSTAGSSMGSVALGAFASGAVQMTQGIRALFEATGDNPERFLDRHFSEDFGDLPPEDLPLNREAVRTGGMVMSVYHASNGERFYVVTDHGHAVTTLLLPIEW